MNELENSAARKMVIETILARLVSGGKINLYYYRDENDKKHFFVNKQGQAQELAYIEYLPGKRI